MTGFRTWYESWPLDMQIAFLLFPFVIIVAWLLLNLYMSYRDLEQMKAAFPKSRYVQGQLSLWRGRDPIARSMQVNAICSVVMISGFYLKRGEVEPDELANFPAHLKSRVVLSSWLLGIGSAWLLLGVGLLKLSGAK
ncbi:hypothetical protein NNO07_06130 [Pseudomonas resinovorans]|uniref:Uncharacterized protein n=1 Tax=Metapseudomonas resinovorans TaxID=53412 RepID=A0ABT4Y1C6_METRE|nr:hypothetical protein [Pseudomonas resinovorans]MDA8482641.1 hypothetical protein [Pseudomonas resinovorans]